MLEQIDLGCFSIVISDNKATLPYQLIIKKQGCSKPQKDGQASPANLNIVSPVCKAHSACIAC